MAPKKRGISQGSRSDKKVLPVNGQRNTRSYDLISRDVRENMQAIRKEITSPALVNVAEEILQILALVKANRINNDTARLRLTSCKHLIQLVALERMKNEMGSGVIVDSRPISA